MEYFNLKSIKNEYNEIIRFLNSSARDFYNSKNNYSYKGFESFFKSTLLTGIVDFERVIKGAYGCDIFMKYCDLKSLKTLFPNAINSIFQIQFEDDLKIMGRILELLRNMNAHAFLSDRDFEFFKYDFSSLQSQKKFNDQITYFNGEITMAGIIFLIMNFLRKESIETLTKKSDIFSVVAWGNCEKKSADIFVEEISGVNLETFIRSEKYENLKDVVIGHFNKYNCGIGDQFNVVIGTQKFPTYKISGEIKQNLILIEKGSLTKTYYKNDYKLEIIDIESFIEISNKVPPFALVDFLYELGISKYDFDFSKTFNSSLPLKLNMPKFYIDKNIKILQLPPSVSDFRLFSSIVSDSITKIVLQLEEYIYKTNHISRSDFSSIGKALMYIGISNETTRNIKYIRNFAVHGYCLDDYMIYDNDIKQFTFDFVLSAFEKMLMEMKKITSDIYHYASALLCEHLINVLVSGKYKKAIIYGRDSIVHYPNINRNEMRIKSDFIKNSCIDISKLDCLIDNVNRYNKVIELRNDSKDETFYLNDNKIDEKLINDFLLKNNYSSKLVRQTSLYSKILVY